MANGKCKMKMPAPDRNATMVRANQANGEGKSKVPAHPADENIVCRVRADRDAKASDDKNPGEEHARHPAEYKGEPGERLTGRTCVVSQREEQRRAGHRQRTGQNR